MSRPLCILAFSGGLDTSLCVVWLREELGYDVITATVDTGGFDADELQRIEERSRQTGALEHVLIDGLDELWHDWIRHIVAANYMKGGLYPLCVGVERVVQARHLVRIARERGAAAVAHGSTGAGNDQIRFDVVLRTLAPDLEVHAPIRQLGWGREQEAEYLAAHGIEVDASTRTYSVNAGLWGTTIGGGETRNSQDRIPDHVYNTTADPSSAPAEGATLELTFRRGGLAAIDGKEDRPVALLRTLDRIAAEHGVGRGVHLGDTVLGIKGRIAFEAPAAQVLIHAHRELEKLVLTKWQLFVKEQVAQFYGLFLHEGRYLDPAMRDIEALFDSTQQRVSGTVTVHLQQGRLIVRALQSPHSLMDATRASYGEESGLWDGRDAEGFARILSIQSALAQRAAPDPES